MDCATNHPLYQTWASMRYRCSDHGRHDYQRYGGRGIKVCQPWLDCFWCFVEDIGQKPSPSHSLDRIDNDGDYEPGNVRWATLEEQRANRRNPGFHFLTFQGRTQPIAHWAREVGIHRHVIRSRIIGAGWSVDRALTTPVMHRVLRLAS